MVLATKSTCQKNPHLSFNYGSVKYLKKVCDCVIVPVQLHLHWIELNLFTFTFTYLWIQNKSKEYMLVQVILA
jgi:hypothetical protein